MSLHRTMIASLAVCALAFSACGGDDDDTASTDDTTAPADDTTTTAAAGGGTVTDAVTILDFKFDPEAATVAAGSEVTFTNDDATPHTATATDAADGFNTDSIEGGGATGSFTAPGEPGTYEYYCSFHPFMVGSIVVE